MAHYTVYLLKLNGKWILDRLVFLSVNVRPPARPPVSYQTIFLAREPQQCANPAPLCAPQGVAVVWTVPSLRITLFGAVTQARPLVAPQNTGSWSFTDSFSYF